MRSTIVTDNPDTQNMVTTNPSVLGTYDIVWTSMTVTAAKYKLIKQEWRRRRACLSCL